MPESDERHLRSGPRSSASYYLVLDQHLERHSGYPPAGTRPESPTIDGFLQIGFTDDPGGVGNSDAFVGTLRVELTL